MTVSRLLRKAYRMVFPRPAPTAPTAGATAPVAIPTAPTPAEPPTQSTEQLIRATFQRLLGREPDDNEMYYWGLSLAYGVRPEDMASTLTDQFDYEENRLSARRILAPLADFKMYISPADQDVGRTILSSGSFEPHVGEMLRARLKPGEVLLDLGANIGYFSLLGATLVGPTGKVISFEPNSQNLRLFHASIQANQFKNIVVFPLAVSDKAQIHQLRSFGSNGYLQDLNQPASSAQFVQSVRVDDVLQGEGRIDVVKMDIEGFEILALRGMRQTVARHRPTLVTEFNPWHMNRSRLEPEEMLQEIEGLGYRLSVIDRSGPLQPTSTRALMDHWRSTNNPAMVVDLLAEPL